MPKVKRISMNFRMEILKNSYNFQTTVLLLKLLYNLQVDRRSATLAALLFCTSVLSSLNFNTKTKCCQSCTSPIKVPVSKKVSERRQNLPSHTSPTFISKSSKEGVATHKNCRASILEISLLLYSKYHFTRNRRSVM